MYCSFINALYELENSFTFQVYYGQVISMIFSIILVAIRYLLEFQVSAMLLHQKIDFNN